MAIGLKFGLIATGATALVLALAATLIFQALRKQDAEQSEKNARASAERLSTAVQRVFSDTFSIVENTHDDLIAMREANIQDPGVSDTLLRRMLADGDRFGGWLVWDGVAAGKAEAEAHGETQRFAVYLHQNGMEMLREAVPESVLASNLYRIPRDEGTAYLLEPHEIDAQNGDPTLVTSFARPMVYEGRVTGVLAVDIKLSAIGDAVTGLDIPAGTKLAVVSDGGMVAAATDPSWIGKSVDSASPKFAEFLDRAKHGGGKTTFAMGSARPVLTAWSPILFSTVKNPWYLLMEVPEVSLLPTSTSARLLLPIGGIALLAILGIAVLIMHVLVARPLRKLSETIEKLGSGLFALEVPGAARSDEIGDVARAINRLQDSGMEIARLQEETGELEYLRVTAREHAAQAISSRFSLSIEAVSGTLNGVAGTVGAQSDDLTLTVCSVVNRLKTLVVRSSTVRTSMSAAEAATDSMITAIEEIGMQTQRGAEATLTVERDAASTNNSLAQLRQAISDIGSTIGLIQSIAGQVNLIALNATIEAARAGDAGRGFAVVAHEVKMLAGRTAIATQHVTAQIKAIDAASIMTSDRVAEMQTAFLGLRTISSVIASQLTMQSNATEALRNHVRIAVASAEDVAGTAVALSTDTDCVEKSAAVMKAQSVTLGEEVGRLDNEVALFVDFLKAA